MYLYELGFCEYLHSCNEQPNAMTSFLLEHLYSEMNLQRPVEILN